MSSAAAVVLCLVVLLSATSSPAPTTMVLMAGGRLIEEISLEGSSEDAGSCTTSSTAVVASISASTNVAWTGCTTAAISAQAIRAKTHTATFTSTEMSLAIQPEPQISIGTETTMLSGAGATVPTRTTAQTTEFLAGPVPVIEIASQTTAGIFESTLTATTSATTAAPEPTVTAGTTGGHLDVSLSTTANYNDAPRVEATGGSKVPTDQLRLQSSDSKNTTYQSTGILRILTETASYQRPTSTTNCSRYSHTTSSGHLSDSTDDTDQSSESQYSPDS